MFVYFHQSTKMKVKPILYKIILEKMINLKANRPKMFSNKKKANKLTKL